MSNRVSPAAMEHWATSGSTAYLREAVVNRIRDLIRRSRRRGIAVGPEEKLPDTQRSPLERAILRQRLDDRVTRLAWEEG
jgi:DNA-directed RNA polymerase specialized sigma24 family protein